MCYYAVEECRVVPGMEYSSGEGLLVMLVLSIWFDWLYFTLRLVWGGLEFCSALAQGRGAEDKELV